MLGWFKKNEGFEWREYVRTTILVRRKKRRDKIEDAKQAAVAGLKEAGRAGAAGLKEAGKAGAAGLKEAGKAGAAGLKEAGRVGATAGATGFAKFSKALVSGLRRLGPAILSGLDATGRAPVRLGALVKPVLMPAGRLVVQSTARGPILLIGLIALGAGISHAVGSGLGTEAMIALGAGATALFICLLPIFLGLDNSRPRWLEAALDRVPSLRLPPAVGGGVIVALVATIGGYAGFRSLEPSARGSLLANLPLASKPIEGRGTVLGPDLMKVGNIIVRLSGTEAPEQEQKCTAGGRKASRCAEAAQEGLSRLVRGKLVSCSLSGSDEAGRSLADCRAEGIDVGLSMVRQGLLFAQQGLLSKYGSAESEARTAKAGMWKGDVQRPSEWRAKRWEEAKRAAPDGCPIKGAVSQDGKVYVLPWSREYERVKVRSGRGERWFCSEQEARAAGWRLADKS